MVHPQRYKESARFGKLFTLHHTYLILSSSLTMQFTYAAIAAALIGALATSAAPLDKRSKSGQATWYRQAGTTGSCGKTHGDDAQIIAVPSHFGSSLCGQEVTIQHNGQKVKATVADECPSCSGNSIDLSRGVFSQLADFEQGEIDVDWWPN